MKKRNNPLTLSRETLRAMGAILPAWTSLAACTIGCSLPCSVGQTCASITMNCNSGCPGGGTCGPTVQ